MLVRPYRDSDQAGVIALFRQFMAELTPRGREAEFEAYVQRAVDEELSRIETYYLGRPGQAFWVAEGGGVLGMAGIERRSDSCAELRRMAVERSQRRRGIARRLLGVAEGFCREAGYRSVALSTSELQVAAMKLYESCGYRRTGSETAEAQTHKTVGGGIARFHYEKAL